MLRLAPLIAIVVCAAALTGCGSASHPVTTTVTAQATASVPAASTGAPAPATTPTATPGENPTDLKPPTRAIHETSFRSPSASIGCVLLDQGARCDIRSRQWSPPPRPKRCPLDYGQGVEVTGAGPGQLVCAGDTALDPNAPSLAYGSAATSGPDLCTSAATGMTCVNQVTRHGFFLSAQRYRTF